MKCNNILKKVEEKEYIRRCLQCLICPQCGDDLIKHDDNLDRLYGDTICRPLHQGAWFCIPCEKLWYPPPDYYDHMIDTTVDVWGGAGPDCPIMRLEAA
jgi:hypothetical protein